MLATPGGPKLRRWYGEGGRLPSDGGGLAEGDGGGGGGEEAEEEGPREAVLVTDADGGMGEQVVLQLILARCALG